MIEVAHGFRMPRTPEPGAIHFGIGLFLESLEVKYGPFATPSIEWPDAWFDREFSQVTTALRGIFNRLILAAEHAGRLFIVLDEATQPTEGLDVSELAPWVNADRDIEIFLDAVIVYFRA